jgi:hypothetical protein
MFSVAHKPFKLCVIMLNVTMLSVILLNVIMLSVSMLAPTHPNQIAAHSTHSIEFNSFHSMRVIFGGWKECQVAKKALHHVVLAKNNIYLNS